MADVREGGGWGTAVARRLAHAVTRQQGLGIILLDGGDGDGDGDGFRVADSKITPDRFQGLAVRANQPLSALIPAGDLAPTAVGLREALATGHMIDGWPRHIRTPGGPMDVEMSVLPVPGEDMTSGHPGLALVIRDATRERRAQALDRLFPAVASIGSSLDVTRTARRVTTAALQLTGRVRCATCNLDADVFSGREPPRRRAAETKLRRAGVASRDGKPWADGFLLPGQDLPPIPPGPVIEQNLIGQPFRISPAEVAASLDYRDDLIRAIVPARGVGLAYAPLRARGLILGSVAVWGEDLTDEDLQLLVLLASPAGLAIDNARRHTRERLAVGALQRSMLPRSAVETTAVSAVGEYLPTTDEGGGGGAGGDWYDVIPLSGARVALVVGDVVGHGMHAAAAMGRLRGAVRAFAGRDPPPAELLAELDDFVVTLAAEDEADDGDGLLFSTCLYAVYNPVDGSLALASAGHPPPAAVHLDGAINLVALDGRRPPLVAVHPEGPIDFEALCPDPPLGASEKPSQITTTICTLAPESTVVLYTDGLIAGGGDVGRGMRAFADRIADRAPIPPASGALRATARHLTGGHAAGLVDDVAVLLARAHRLPRRCVAEWDIDRDPAAVATARRHAGAQLTTWHLDDAAFGAELVVSELVTNAIRYGTGPIRLRLIRPDAADAEHAVTEHVVIEVSDASDTQPRLRLAAETDEGGRGVAIVARICDKWGSRYMDGPGKIVWCDLLVAPTRQGREEEEDQYGDFDIDAVEAI